ncbi:efflux transporter outer membrane subunit [Verminephrobacter aporrectodeae subsp. tuberculatae]|uniref:efflux transporter outer membrane subunit n=1 Tax=Verminephrobacter aporrectodeae TaxID=1110389 RepID=UPI002244BC6A|nr:efflux transporter outer membrane subunit [Verminephrobacter aporrectodeae]MCW8199338.1 efflux transporter outer membrane subunit [Verminephrobacter aporrectodeae subsp. tuberculatae]
MTPSLAPRASPAAAARRLSLALAVALLPACSVAPPYQRPEIPLPAAFKEAGATWAPAVPADALEHGAWWEAFGDAELNRLAQQLQQSNQNIAAAVAAQAQAQAVLRQQRAALWPAVGLSGRSTRSGGAAANRSSDSAKATLELDWAPDLWGRLSSGLNQAQASAQASAADLAGARLAALGSLAAAYFQLRAADAEIDLLDATVAGYARSLHIVQNRYAAGIAAQTDVLQAQTQHANARADLAALHQQRAQLEHAVAVLTGQAPAAFALPRARWIVQLPEIPPGLPSTLLQRRPDIAAAERAVAAANAQIGVQHAAYFPSLSLNASLGGSGSGVAELLRAPGTLWSLGLTLAQALFDAGANAARQEQAQAAHGARVAVYRQTVLTAFQSVEDQLTRLHTLQEQEPLRREATAAAERSAQQMLNRYHSGQLGYTEVVTAQATALSAQRALLQLQLERQLAVVALIQALGGGWQLPWQEPLAAADARGG